MDILPPIKSVPDEAKIRRRKYIDIKGRHMLHRFNQDIWNLLRIEAQYNPRDYMAMLLGPTIFNQHIFEIITSFKTRLTSTNWHHATKPNPWHFIPTRQRGILIPCTRLLWNHSTRGTKNIPGVERDLACRLPKALFHNIVPTVYRTLELLEH